MEENNEVIIDNNPDKKLDISKIKNSIKSNPWMASTIVVGIIAVILMIILASGGITGNVISETEAGKKIIDFAEAQGVDVTLSEVNEKGNLYEVVVLFEGQELPLYITKDGNYLVQGLAPLESVSSPSPEPEPQEIPKSDKPKVELFVMTHCPYGIEAQKVFAPVMDLLSEFADMRVRFVYYAMHGKNEVEEEMRQTCIQQEYSDKYLDYLTCFLS